MERISKAKLAILTAVGSFISQRVHVLTQQIKRKKKQYDLMIAALKEYVLGLYRQRLDKIMRINKEKNELIKHFKTALLNKIDEKRAEIDEKYRRVKKMLDLLKYYLIMDYNQKLAILLENEAVLPKNKFKNMTKEEMYKLMDLHDMFLDDDVPIDYMMAKIDTKKAKYISPDADLIKTWSYKKKSYDELKPLS